ncbi:hypothetical protein P4637_03400 [Halalkalibacterium halodurans]|uniref:hypothetical protein n=1 Tax=Halalkalibacterium halodurans TaxID=86665 RepID=UPI002E20EBCA|nr:hypothetical protein [Halalkalibacterium halodurans]MED4105545.1 hypothetical protein [Halalkalibacterium halodurans]MED4109249.1 hypothetical protein [Halalkalibacterium halodurans]MED4149737.1 hypothetical protein [Halalkalibacterium halodurans]
MLTKYDTWKTDSPLSYAKVICQCGTCHEPLFEGYDAIPYNGEYYCGDECYYEQLCRDNQPRYIELEEGGDVNPLEALRSELKELKGKKAAAERTLDLCEPRIQKFEEIIEYLEQHPRYRKENKDG